MAVTFVNAGALAANATTTTLAVVAPTLSVGDIMVAAILGKDNLVITAPANWTKFVEVDNTTAQRLTLAWKRAEAGDSGATFNFTKPTDNNLLFCGVISAWAGAIAAGDPTTGAGTPTTSLNASADAVTYATFDPLIACHVVAIGVYNNDLTTAGAISGTDPTLTNRWDLETATGSDGSIFGYSGDSTGAATGARSHSTTSSADAISIGALFGLEASTGTQFNQSVSGALTFSGAFVKQGAKVVIGGLTFSGSFTKLGQKVVTGGLTFLGTITKGAQKGVSGALTFSGALTSSLLRVIAFTAALTFTGIITRQTEKVAAGSLTFSGALVKEAQRALTGALTFSGGITKATLKTVAAALTFAGTLLTNIIRTIAFTAALTFSGTMAKLATKAITASLSFTGATTRRIAITVGRPFLFTSANWGTQSFFLEVFMRATGGTAEAELYNTTDGAAVANSAVSTTSASLVRLRSAAITLADGKEYRLRLLREGPDGGAILSGQIIAA